METMESSRRRHAFDELIRVALPLAILWIASCAMRQSPTADASAATAPPATSGSAHPASSAPEEDLDALVARGWRQRIEDKLTEARATFVRAMALVPHEVPYKAGWFGSASELHPVSARPYRDLHGGSGANEASILVDPKTLVVVRWFGGAEMFPATHDHALLVASSRTWLKTAVPTSAPFRRGPLRRAAAHLCAFDVPSLRLVVETTWPSVERPQWFEARDDGRMVAKEARSFSIP